MASRQIRIVVHPLPNYTIDHIRHRADIRRRALIYAEYELFSVALMNNQTVYHINRTEWIERVQNIETLLILQEDRHLQFLSVDDYEPKRLFFDGFYIVPGAQAFETVTTEPEEILP